MKMLVDRTRYYVLCTIILTAVIPRVGSWAQDTAENDVFAEVDLGCFLYRGWERVRPRNSYRNAGSAYGAQTLADAAKEELGPEEAVPDVWYAVACNNPAALFFAGWIHEMEGATSDNESADLDHQRVAFRYYELAAQAGYPWAESNVCARLMWGDGVSRNRADAFNWCQSAATKGMSNAQYHLAVMYWNGLGVERNLTEAYFWYSVALPGLQSLDRSSAIKRMGEVEDSISQQRILELQRQASDFLPNIEWQELFCIQEGSC